MTKTIPLTQGKVALVDDEDYPALSKFKWYAAKDGNTFYAIRSSNRDPKSHTRNTTRMHVEIIGILPGKLIDHINGNGLDNRRENLRAVTRRQNAQNRHVPTSSKYPGVSWFERYHKWEVQIHVNGKQHNLGRYEDEATAATVYRVACKSLGVD